MRRSNYHNESFNGNAPAAGFQDSFSIPVVSLSMHQGFKATICIQTKTAVLALCL